MTDSMDTIDGVLVSAKIGGVGVERDPVNGVVLTLLKPVLYEGDAVVLLDWEEIRRLAHALNCALVPYGGR